jgi:hypothetical protein
MVRVDGIIYFAAKIKGSGRAKTNVELTSSKNAVTVKVEGQPV